MRRQETLFRLLLGMGLALATTAPAFAAPIFGAASNLQITACYGNPNTPSGSLSATPVNGGAGAILSGSASVTAGGTLCMQLEWGGSMSGSVDTVADVPIAWDVLTSVTDLTEPVVSTDIYIEVSHEPYMVGTFNQGGYAYGTSRVGIGQFTSPANLRMTWSGPPPETPRNFTSYYVRSIVLYENTSSNLETLSVDLPSATSINLGNLRGGVVPEPATWSLIAAGLAGIAWRRRAIRGLQAARPR